MSPDFFISYVRADKDWAEWIAYQLEKAGYRCVLQAWDFRPGSDFLDAINKALAQSRRVLAVLSPDYFQSRYAAAEARAALAHTLMGHGDKLLPIRVREVEPPALFASINYIDLADLDQDEEAAAIERLMAGLDPQRKKHSGSPPFPAHREPAQTKASRQAEEARPPDVSRRLSKATFAKRYAELQTSKDSDSAVLLLHFACCFSPTAPIPQQLLLDVAVGAESGLQGPIGHVQTMQDLRRLSSIGLVSLQRGGSVTLDPHLREHVRSRPDFSQAEPILESSLIRECERLLESAAGTLDATRTLEHLEAAAETSWKRTAGDDPLAAERIASLYSCLGRLQMNSGNLDAARFSFDRSLRSRESVIALQWSELGQLHYSLQEIETAESYLHKSLELLEKWLGKDHLETAQCLSRLGHCLLWREEHQQARELFQRSLDIRKAASGPEHADTATAYRDLAWADIHAGDFEQAESRLKEALRIRQKRLGPAHHLVGYCLHDLGVLCRRRNRPEEAEDYFRQALAVRQQSLPAQHPSGAETLNNLGSVLRDLGKIEEARKCYEEALAIRTRVFGPEGLDVARTSNNLGVLLRNLGDFDAARSHLETALRTRRQKLGEDHPETLQSLDNMGVLLLAQGKHIQAQELFEQTWKTRREGGAKHYPDMGRSLYLMGYLHQVKGERRQACDLYRQALQIFETAPSPDSPSACRQLREYLRQSCREASASKHVSSQSPPTLGIDATTGRYLDLPPLVDPLKLLDLGPQGLFDPVSLRDLRWRQERYGIKNPDRWPARDVDPQKLESSGWGVIFAPDIDEEVKEALRPLFDHRKEQACKEDSRFYKEFSWEAGRSKHGFLRAHKIDPGPPDPRRMPYYLLIVGDPQTLPYRFQYELDTDYAVGRIHFPTAEEYAAYARHIVDAETRTGRLPSREVAFFGVSNPDDEEATGRTLKDLVRPLAQALAQERSGWPQRMIAGPEATKSRLAELFSPAQTPSLLFTACHGLRFGVGHPNQEQDQGALLCQDWPGPQAGGAVSPDHYFAAHDLGPQSSLLGMIVCHFVCYGAGTPQVSDFESPLFGKPRPVAQRCFLSRLAQRMLSRGALAVLGHVDRTWTSSFDWTGEAQTSVFENTLKTLLDGYPAGFATEYVNQRYVGLAAEMANLWEDREQMRQVSAKEFNRRWQAVNDARNFVLVGDPAVRLVYREDGES